MAAILGTRQNLRQVTAIKTPVKIYSENEQLNDTLVFDPTLGAYRNSQSTGVQNTQTACITEALLFFTGQF